MIIINESHPFFMIKKERLKCVLFIGAEFINGLLHINFTGLQLGAWEVCTVGRVGEVLGLKAQARVLAKSGAMLTLVTVCPIVAIELNTGFCGPALHGAAGGGFYHRGCQCEFAGFVLVQNIAVVIAGAVLYLLVIGGNIATYGLGSAEVKGSALYLANLAGGYAVLINGHVEVCIDGQDGVQL